MNVEVPGREGLKAGGAGAEGISEAMPDNEEGAEDLDVTDCDHLGLAKQSVVAEFGRHRGV